LRLTAPNPLDETHRLDDFRCSAPELGKWLQERALQNQMSGASRCFVVCDERQQVVGYYALAAGSVSHDDAPGRIRRNMPDPIPVIVLGRLAVHVDWAGLGIGQGLLKDAVLRTLQACTQIGARALLCHAIDDAAKAFYAKHGFIKSPIHDMTLMLPLTLRSSR
jgi:predicted N-acetyltransferase YhbS